MFGTSNFAGHVQDSGCCTATLRLTNARRNSTGLKESEITMKKLFASALLLFVLGCTDGNKATRVLTDQGFKDITLTGYRPFMCSEDDTFKTGFAATSPSGKHVTGAVCSGWFKGATVRMD